MPPGGRRGGCWGRGTLLLIPARCFGDLPRSLATASRRRRGTSPATAGLGTVGAKAPCMRLYAWLGAALDAGAAGPYAQWVQTYANPNFDVSATRLGRLLDEQADDRSAVRAAYRLAMHLSWSSLTQHSYPQAEHHLGRAAPRRPTTRRPKQTGQRRMTLVPRLRRGTRAQCCTPTRRPMHEVM